MSAHDDHDNLAQSQRDMLRGTRDGRHVSAVSWPDVPVHARCDRCCRDAQAGSALCGGCADDEWWEHKIKAEEKDG